MRLKVFIAISILFALWSANKKADQQHPIVSASQQPTLEHKPEPQEVLSITTPPVPHQQVSEAKEGQEELKKYLISQHPAAIEARIEKRDSFIGRYRLLGQRKVLLSSEETNELDAMLQDREKWGDYQKYLHRSDFAAHAVADEQMYRLFLLQYFESSLSAQKDPEIVDFLISFVLEDNFGSQLSTEVKKVVAYEKIKALGILWQQSPASLEIIKQKMIGVRHENLLRSFFDNPPAA